VESRKKTEKEKAEETVGEEEERRWVLKSRERGRMENCGLGIGKKLSGKKQVATEEEVDGLGRERRMKLWVGKRKEAMVGW
jgi:hypothetical protein